MFTINIYLRFAIIGICLLAGIATSILYGIGYGILFFIIAIIFIVGYFLLGTVQSAAQLVQEMKFLEAEKRLALTVKPNWLFKANRAYYFLIKGMVAIQLKRTEEGEKHLQRAQDIGLAGDNEKGMVSLQLANLAASKGKWNIAKLHHRNMKDLKITEPSLKEQVVQFQKALSNRGVMKAGNRGQTFQPGGKRRRPRAR